MKMVIAIVNVDDAPRVSECLAEKGYGATCMHSQGAFLGQENRTILAGVSAEKVNEVVNTICSAVHRRSTHVTGRIPRNIMQVEEGSRITVSGATLFVLDVDRFLRI